jgi:hypothetical protein
VWFWSHFGHAYLAIHLLGWTDTRLDPSEKDMLRTYVVSKVFPPEDLMRRQIMLRRYRQRIQFVILKSRENVLGYELGEKGGHLVALIKLNGLFGKIERLNTFNARSLRSTVNSNGGLPRQLSI